jgi:hypothetical protein
MVLVVLPTSLVLVRLVRHGGGPATTQSPAASGTAPPPGSPVTGMWAPSLSTPWQWELDHPLDPASPRDMGTGATDHLGHPAPDPVMYDIDGFNNPASTIAALHAKGKRAVCYIETGAWESYRPDAPRFPQSVLGSTMPGYRSERYLDIRQIAILEPIIVARLEMCRSKGFDAVEPDIDDAYAEGAGVTGFPLTMEDQIRYNTVVARDAHAAGLSIALKNGDNPAFASAMAGVTDFAIAEQCVENNTCGAFTAFINAGKAVFEVEYQLDPPDFCPAVNALRFNAEKQTTGLGGGRVPCR